jgi:hypothetical protein
MEGAREIIQRNTQLSLNGQGDAPATAFLAVMAGDFDTAAELLMYSYSNKDGTWTYPVWVRLPEQAPDSEPWQEFWRQPGAVELAEIRRGHGLSPHVPSFGEGEKP